MRTSWWKLAGDGENVEAGVLIYYVDNGASFLGVHSKIESTNTTSAIEDAIIRRNKTQFNFL
jgi:hypothetical protein